MSQPRFEPEHFWRRDEECYGWASLLGVPEYKIGNAAEQDCYYDI
jgi:hypothetical protein